MRCVSQLRGAGLAGCYGDYSGLVSVTMASSGNGVIVLWWLPEICTRSRDDWAIERVSIVF